MEYGERGIRTIGLALPAATVLDLESGEVSVGFYDLDEGHFLSEQDVNSAREKDQSDDVYIPCGAVQAKGVLTKFGGPGPRYIRLCPCTKFRVLPMVLSWEISHTSDPLPSRADSRRWRKPPSGADLTSPVIATRRRHLTSLKPSLAYPSLSFVRRLPWNPLNTTSNTNICSSSRLRPPPTLIHTISLIKDQCTPTPLPLLLTVRRYPRTPMNMM